jgi:adenylate cyclase
MRREARPLVYALCVAGSVVVGLASGPHGAVGGLTVDLLEWLRQSVFGPRRDAAQAAVAVVLVDEATYAAPEFHNTPKEMWTPQIGAVLDAINQAGPRAVGFDIILPTTLGALKSDYDVPFAQALHHLATAHRIVLAKFQSGGEPLLPYRGYAVAAGGDAALRSINLIEDADGIVRGVPTMIAAANAGRPAEPSFSLDLARRQQPKVAAGETLELNFDGGAPFPTYSFVDVLACARAGNAALLTEAFANKIVLIGSSLNVEDRQLTSRRLINPPDAAVEDRCMAQSPAPRPAFARPTLPGVLIHATAIDNLLRGEGLLIPSLLPRIGAVAVASGLAGGLALLAPLLAAIVGLMGLLIAIAAVATWLFQHAVVFPMVEGWIAASLGFMLLLGFRLLVTDRDKRLIRSMFGLYLAPSVIEPMIAANRLPALGGERRELSFLFSDVAGFTTLTEGADPTRLAPVLNGYFDGMCEAVMRHGGLVVEFLGDGVLALFGAPETQPDHAARAVACARDMDRFTETYRSTGEAKELGFGHTRIGVHTGAAMVGNFGATQRLKYAALGDVVNATSRLEGLNKFIGTRICISDVTRAASLDRNVRPIGEFVLKGKSEAILVFEVLENKAEDWDAVYARIARGEPAVKQTLEELALRYPDDGWIGFHLNRVREGKVSVRILMEEK